MPRTITGTPRRATALLAAPVALAAVLLSGCSAGQISQTDTMRPAVPGANADSANKAVSLRNVLISYPGATGHPKGGVAPLEVRVFNNTVDRKVTLRRVTATSVRTGVSLGPVVLVGPAPSVGAGTVGPGAGSPGTPSSPAASRPPAVSPPASPSAPPGSAPPGSAPPGSASPPASAPPASAPPAGNPDVSVTIPPVSYANLVSSSGGHLAISGLTEALLPGDSATLEFVFEIEAGGPFSVTLDGPVAVPSTPLPRVTPSDEH